jgi:hypothetical protein
MRFSRHDAQYGNAYAFVLALALLFAQWAGIAHRIEHAPLHHPAQVFSQFDDDGHRHHHSCLAFDAAAVADTVCLPPFVAPLLDGAQVLALRLAFISWNAPPVRHFSSRAPPDA